jgi:hypothetical protein
MLTRADGIKKVKQAVTLSSAHAELCRAWHLPFACGGRQASFGVGRGRCLLSEGSIQCALKQVHSMTLTVDDGPNNVQLAKKNVPCRQLQDMRIMCC